MQDNNTLSLVQIFFRNKWVRTVLILNILIIIAVIAIVIYNNTKTAIITFELSPIDATISINGDTNYATNATYRLIPGSYDITISHDNLDSKSFHLVLPEHSSTYLSTYLSADNGTDFSFYEQKDNHESAQKLLSIASPTSNLTYDHDTTASNFVTEYGATLNAFEKALPIQENTHESPDNGGKVVSVLSIQKGESCEKYLCVLAYSIDIPNATNKINELLEKNGLNLKYLDIKYETN